MAVPADFVLRLDPRLKLAVAFVMGPLLWKVGVVTVAVCGFLLLVLLAVLSMSQPLGGKMVRSMAVFVLFWVGVKVGLEFLAGAPPDVALSVGGELALRLFSLLALGLALALSTSARSLGLAVAWAMRPFLGAERAWRVALSLALMIHFLPLCLGTLHGIRETVSRRCPGYGFFKRMKVIPLAFIRNLGQKTWNQTLAIAGRRLDRADAWRADFSWSVADWVCSFLFAGAVALMVIWPY